MPAVDVEAILTAAGALVRERGARRLVIDVEGIALTHYDGSVERLTAGGAPVVVPLEDVQQFLQRRRNYSYRRSRPDEYEIAGDSFELEDAEGIVTLKTKKVRHPALELLADFPDGALSTIRRAYALGDAELVVRCEGETRARDIAIAIANECSMLGYQASLAVPFEPNFRAPPAQFAFDDRRAGEVRTIRFGAEKLTNDALLSPSGLNVVVSPNARYRMFAQQPYQEALDKSGRPLAFVQIELVKSNPVAQVVISKTLADLVAVVPEAEDGPWRKAVERREAVKARPRAEKTWHPTTEAVAEAFGKRLAPRGYVSGRSLYFHGPIAYSSWDRNPIAAFVGAPRAEAPVLFLGRGRYGEGDGVTSMAQADVVIATRERYTIVGVDDLSDILEFEGRRPDEVASGMRRDQNEAERPATCTLDKARTRSWLQDRMSAAEIEVIDAGKVKFATLRKADSYRQVLEVEKKRSVLNELFDLDLGPLCDVDAIEAKRQEASEAANARKDELLARRREARSAPTL